MFVLIGDPTVGYNQYSGSDTRDGSSCDRSVYIGTLTAMQVNAKQLQLGRGGTGRKITQRSLLLEDVGGCRLFGPTGGGAVRLCPASRLDPD